VADHGAFVTKLGSHLCPHGLLMMATQNRIPPPAPGQLGRWFDRRQLRDLLELEFEVLELFSVTPRANRGIMRPVNSKTLNRPIRATVGDRIEKLKEAVGLC